MTINCDSDLYSIQKIGFPMEIIDPREQLMLFVDFIEDAQQDAVM